MNKLYPMQNSLYFGPLPEPMEFNSITGFFRSEWLTEYIEIVGEDELKILCDGAGPLLFLLDDEDMYEIGHLETLEHISPGMIMTKDEYISRLEKGQEKKREEKVTFQIVTMANNLQLLKNADLERNYTDNVRLFNIVTPFFEYVPELSNEQCRFIDALTELVEAQHDLIEKTKNYYADKE